jgi:PadR family transcriptional regulator PadR
MMAPRAEVLQGTLDLIVLKTLDAIGPLHGYGIAQRIQQVSEDLLKLNQGTLYPAGSIRTGACRRTIARRSITR